MKGIIVSKIEKMVKAVYGFDYVGHFRIFGDERHLIMPIYESLYEMDLTDENYYAMVDKREYKKEKTKRDLEANPWAKNDIEDLAAALSFGDNDYFIDLDYAAEEYTKHKMLYGVYKDQCDEYFARKAIPVKRSDDFIVFVKIEQRRDGRVCATVSDGYALGKEQYLQAKERYSGQTYPDMVDDGYNAERYTSYKEKYPAFETCVADVECAHYGVVDCTKIKKSQTIAISFKDLQREYASIMEESSRQA